ncbi:GYF domain-containing protein [Myxococcota bacterium]
MALVLTCAACGKRLNIPDSLFETKIRGRTVTISCKQCGADIRVDGTKSQNEEVVLPTSSQRGSAGEVRLAQPRTSAQVHPPAGVIGSHEGRSAPALPSPERPSFKGASPGGVAVPERKPAARIAAGMGPSQQKLAPKPEGTGGPARGETAKEPGRLGSKPDQPAVRVEGTGGPVRGETRKEPGRLGSKPDQPAVRVEGTGGPVRGETRKEPGRLGSKPDQPAVRVEGTDGPVRGETAKEPGRLGSKPDQPAVRVEGMGGPARGETAKERRLAPKLDPLAPAVAGLSRAAVLARGDRGSLAQPISPVGQPRRITPGPGVPALRTQALKIRSKPLGGPRVLPSGLQAVATGAERRPESADAVAGSAADVPTPAQGRQVPGALLPVANAGVVSAVKSADVGPLQAAVPAAVPVESEPARTPGPAAQIVAIPAAPDAGAAGEGGLVQVGPAQKPLPVQPAVAGPAAVTGLTRPPPLGPGAQLATPSAGVSRPIPVALTGPAPSETLWAVSFGEDDDRELTLPEIIRALRTAQISGESIVWREGMPDWAPLREVPEFGPYLGSLEDEEPTRFRALEDVETLAVHVAAYKEARQAAGSATAAGPGPLGAESRAPSQSDDVGLISEPPEEVDPDSPDLIESLAPGAAALALRAGARRPIVPLLEASDGPQNIVRTRMADWPPPDTRTADGAVSAAPKPELPLSLPSTTGGPAAAVVPPWDETHTLPRLQEAKQPLLSSLPPQLKRRAPLWVYGTVVGGVLAGGVVALVVALARQPKEPPMVTPVATEANEPVTVGSTALAAQGLSPGAPPQAGPEGTEGHGLDLATAIERNIGKGSQPSQEGFRYKDAQLLLAVAADRAADCRSGTDKRGPTEVAVTFATDGKVSRTEVLPPYVDTTTGQCLQTTFSVLKTRAFTGQPVTLTQKVRIR